MLVDTRAHGVITKPYRSTGILSTLVLARASSGYQQRLQNKIGKLEDAIRHDATLKRQFASSLRRTGKAKVKHTNTSVREPQAFG
jgi:AmiR/NasT family two-component response regulator